MIKNKISRYLILVLLICLLVGAGFLYHARYDDSTRPTPTTGSQYTKGIKLQSNSPVTSNSNLGNSSGKTPSTQGVSGNSTPTTTQDLLAPEGTFANVYNATETQEMSSTCNTTPGATCQIIFTNGNLTRYLPSKTTDSGGAAYWGWQPQTIGLTAGTWHITAMATLGSQTKSTSNDPLMLNVQ